MDDIPFSNNAEIWNYPDIPETQLDREEPALSTKGYLPPAQSTQMCSLQAVRAGSIQQHPDPGASCRGNQILTVRFVSGKKPKLGSTYSM